MNSTAATPEQRGEAAPPRAERFRAKRHKPERTTFQTNLFAVQDRTAELHADLHFLTTVGYLWNEIFQAIDLPLYARVLDISSGFFPKIELGLYYFDFRGSVTLLSPDEDALRRSVSFLRFFNSLFETDPLHGGIWSEEIQKPYDLIVGNHFLDDALLSLYQKEKNISLSDIYRTEATFQEAWREIKGDRALNEKFLELFVSRLIELSIPGTQILFVDYTSCSHESLGFSDINEFLVRLQNDLRKRLAQNGFRTLRSLSRFKGHLGRTTIQSQQIIYMKYGSDAERRPASYARG